MTSCGAALADWFTPELYAPDPDGAPRLAITVGDLPPACHALGAHDPVPGPLPAADPPGDR